MRSALDAVSKQLLQQTVQTMVVSKKTENYPDLSPNHYRQVPQLVPACAYCLSLQCFVPCPSACLLHSVSLSLPLRIFWSNGLPVLECSWCMCPWSCHPNMPGTLPQCLSYWATRSRLLDVSLHVVFAECCVFVQANEDCICSSPRTLTVCLEYTPLSANGVAHVVCCNLSNHRIFWMRSVFKRN